MSDDIARRALIGFQLTLGLVVLLTSLLTAVRAVGVAHLSTQHLPIFVLAVVEVIFAGLFLVPRTTRVGGWVLVAILTLATVLHSMDGQFPSHLVVYIAGTILVIVHRDAFVVAPTASVGIPNHSNHPIDEPGTPGDRTERGLE